MIYRLHCDGAVTKNPGGEASYGYVLHNDEKEVSFGYGIIGSGANINNVMAECYAISQGIASFIRHWNHADSTLYVYNDSKFVVSQLKRNTIDDIEFRYITSQLQQIRNFVDVKLVWIPRKSNIFADILSKRLRDQSELLKAYSDKEIYG